MKNETPEVWRRRIVGHIAAAEMTGDWFTAERLDSIHIKLWADTTQAPEGPGVPTVQFSHDCHNGPSAVSLIRNALVVTCANCDKDVTCVKLAHAYPVEAIVAARCHDGGKLRVAYTNGHIYMYCVVCNAHAGTFHVADLGAKN